MAKNYRVPDEDIVPVVPITNKRAEPFRCMHCGMFQGEHIDGKCLFDPGGFVCKNTVGLTRLVRKHVRDMLLRMQPVKTGEDHASWMEIITAGDDSWDVVARVTVEEARRLQESLRQGDSSRRASRTPKRSTTRRSHSRP